PRRLDGDCRIRRHLSMVAITRGRTRSWAASIRMDEDPLADHGPDSCFTHCDRRSGPTTRSKQRQVTSSVAPRLLTLRHRRRGLSRELCDLVAGRRRPTEIDLSAPNHVLDGAPCVIFVPVLHEAKTRERSIVCSLLDGDPATVKIFGDAPGRVRTREHID